VSGNPVMSIDPRGLAGATVTPSPGGILGTLFGASPVAQPGSPENASWSNNAWNQMDGALSSLGQAVAGIGRPKGMTSGEESVYDRYCSGQGDPCAALKAATMAEILSAQRKMNELLYDKLGISGSDSWFNHQNNLRFKILKIYNMINLGQLMGCDMTAESLAAINLTVPYYPK
jgi:hypothetical protein